MTSKLDERALGDLYTDGSRQQDPTRDGMGSDAEMEDGEAPAASMDDFPEGMKVNTSNAGGEVSMSLEETNRVREKLG